MSTNLPNRYLRWHYTVAVYHAFAQLTETDSVQHRFGNYFEFSQLKE